MARIIDFAALAVIVFMLTLVWSTLVFSSWALVFLVASAVTVITLFTAVYIKRGRNRPCSLPRFVLECAIRPPSYLVGLLKLTDKSGVCAFGDNYILTPDSVIFAAVRLGALGVNDLNNLITKAEELGRKRVFVITEKADRRAFRLLEYRPVRLNTVKVRTAYRRLSRAGVLPELKSSPRKLTVAAFWESLFSRSNLKNYLFTGFILMSVAFLTPLKIYYLIFGTVALLLALCTLTPLGTGSFGGEKAFAPLDAAPPTADGKDETEEKRKDGGDSGANADDGKNADGAKSDHINNADGSANDGKNDGGED